MCTTTKRTVSSDSTNESQYPNDGRWTLLLTPLSQVTQQIPQLSDNPLMFSHHLPTDRPNDWPLSPWCDLWWYFEWSICPQGFFLLPLSSLWLGWFAGWFVPSFLHLLGVRVVSHLFYPWRTLFRICFHLFCNKWPFPCYPFNWGVLLWCCCCVTWVAENLWWLLYGWNWIWVIIIVS